MRRQNMSRVAGSHCIRNSSIRILFSIDGRGLTESGASRAWAWNDSAKDNSRLCLLLTRRRKARKRYDWRSFMGGWLIAFALMARETVAAASSSRFAATAGSMSCRSAWRRARRPISSAALRTAGLITRPRRSTGLTRTPPSLGCAFSAIGPLLHWRQLIQTIPTKPQHLILTPTIPPTEKEYPLTPKPQLKTILSIPRVPGQQIPTLQRPALLDLMLYSVRVLLPRPWNS